MREADLNNPSMNIFDKLNKKTIKKQTLFDRKTMISIDPVVQVMIIV